MVNSTQFTLEMFNFSSSEGIIIKIVLALLILCSVLSWAIIFRKRLAFRSFTKKINNIETQFNFLSQPSYQQVEHLLSGTDYTHYLKALRFFYHNQNFFTFPVSGVVGHLDDAKRNAVNDVSRGAVNDFAMQQMYSYLEPELNYLSDGLSTLATLGSTAPFIGLFGTVVGIIDSFSAIGSAASVSLSNIAPGIAESLVATAMGLFVAIPAVFMYNIFSRKAAQLELQQEHLINRLVFYFI